MSGSAVNRRWTYDGASNLLSLGDDRWGTSQFDYDSNDQITRSAFGGMIAVEERFGYDANLNIREQSRLPRGAMSSFEQVQQRQVRGRVVSRGEDDYRYDAAGRLTEKCRYRDGYRPQRWRYRWDGYDRLSELMTPSGVRWRYSYDPFGRRIRKQKVIAENRADTRPAGTEYRWSGDQMIAETPVYADGTAAYDESIHWLYAPGALTPVARYQKGQLHYVVSDHMGTPRELLTEQGKVAWAGRLSTWGEVTEWPVAANDADKLSCNLRFAGQYADEESGLHYNRFRYYDNWTGQYLSPDPIGLLGGVNPYGYVTNPLSWVDPLGLVCVCPDKASRELDASANKVTVKSRSDAEQLFLDRYVGDGYRNMTGESGPSTKNLMDFLTNKNTKAGTYHWDDIMDPNNPGRVSGHGAGNPDGDLPHLQVHQNDGKIIHIFFPWE